MKKLLLLGGLRYLIPVIKKAKALGYYVITCDYIPDNIAHSYSDEYHNVSIIDKEAVLELAQRLEIDGIMSFAVDPGVPTASYVAEKMGLCFPPYASVQILQNKGLFRQFLKDNHFNVPFAYSYKTKEAAQAQNFDYPVIVKPVDSAGSKGVTKVSSANELNEAIDVALKFSIGGEYIIEEFIEPLGYSTDCDSFSINNQMIITTFDNQHFDKKAANPYTPAAYSWPPLMQTEHQELLRSEIQRLVKLLNLGTSIYNIETRVGTNGTPYIMELSPRGGGNRLAEMVHHVYGVDLIEMTVRGVMGEEINPNDFEPTTENRYLAELILHADNSGIYQSIEIDPRFEANVIELDLWVNEGDTINAFNGANDTIGTMVLKFDTQEELNAVFEGEQSIYTITVK